MDGDEVIPYVIIEIHYSFLPACYMTFRLFDVVQPYRHLTLNHLVLRYEEYSLVKKIRANILRRVVL